MKKIIYLLAIAVGISSYCLAENNDPNPQRELGLQSIIATDNLSPNVQKRLTTLINQVVTRSGMIVDGQSPYALAVTLNEQSHVITGTIPPMHMLELIVTFTIINTETNKVFAVNSLTLKGVNSTPEKAIMTALKTLRPTHASFKPFMEKGRDLIRKDMPLPIEENQQSPSSNDTIPADSLVHSVH